jgi:hypothetical protein
MYLQAPDSCTFQPVTPHSPLNNSTAPSESDPGIQRSDKILPSSGNHSRPSPVLIWTQSPTHTYNEWLLSNYLGQLL